MGQREEYLKRISNRGNERGEDGGLLDLLEWCGKYGLNEVTEQEAKLFLENPKIPYDSIMQKKTK